MIVQSVAPGEVQFGIINSNSTGSAGFIIGLGDETAPLFTLSTISTVSPFVYAFQDGDSSSGDVITGALGVQFSIASAELRFVPPPSPAPEPAALGLLSLGLAGLWQVRRRKPR